TRCCLLSQLTHLLGGVVWLSEFSGSTGSDAAAYAGALLARAGGRAEVMQLHESLASFLRAAGRLADLVAVASVASTGSVLSRKRMARVMPSSSGVSLMT